MERLKVQNGQIVKTSGDPIYLRGYNIGGWLNMEDFINGFVGVERFQAAWYLQALSQGGFNDWQFDSHC